MKRITARRIRSWLGAATMAAVCVSALVWHDVGGDVPTTVDIPTLTGWGKIFSALLLTAMGVAYLVWRRPVMQAQAILETSPLGAGHRMQPLMDWRLYLNVLLGVEAVALVSVLASARVGHPLSVLDRCGVLGSGAIVALVAHLLLIARGDGGHRYWRKRRTVDRSERLDLQNEWNRRKDQCD